MKYEIDQFDIFFYSEKWLHLPREIQKNNRA